jgi:hypothetical protein
MKINKKSIEFNSDEMMFKKEKYRKLNTERLLTRSEREELERMLLGTQEPITIIIHNYSGQTNTHRHFKRQITDISCVGDLLGHYMYVFSWKQE